MNLYIVSGLGADDKVLEKLKFPDHINVKFLSWLMPEIREEFDHYITRMADRIDETQPFCLLGYSFGGIVVQEIHKIKKAQKVVILGSIRSSKEKSRLIKAGEISKLPKYFPKSMYSGKSTIIYAFFRKLFDPKNPRLMQYFRVRDPYYLKWSVEKVCEWKSEEISDVIQILGDKDIVFPLQYSKPDYVIKGGTHLFPATKHKEVSAILSEIFS